MYSEVALWQSFTISILPVLNSFILRILDPNQLSLLSSVGQNVNATQTVSGETWKEILWFFTWKGDSQRLQCANLTKPHHTVALASSLRLIRYYKPMTNEHIGYVGLHFLVWRLTDLNVITRVFCVLCFIIYCTFCPFRPLTYTTLDELWAGWVKKVSCFTVIDISKARQWPWC